MQSEASLTQSVKEKWVAEGKNVNVDHLTTLVNSQTKIPLKILRVNQLDAVILDQELNEILKYQFNKIFSLFPVCFFNSFLFLFKVLIICSLRLLSLQFNLNREFWNVRPSYHSFSN